MAAAMASASQALDSCIMRYAQARSSCFSGPNTTCAHCIEGLNTVASTCLEAPCSWVSPRELRFVDNFRGFRFNDVSQQCFPALAPLSFDELGDTACGG